MVFSFRIGIAALVLLLVILTSITLNRLLLLTGDYSHLYLSIKSLTNAVTAKIVLRNNNEKNTSLAWTFLQNNNNNTLHNLDPILYVVTYASHAGSDDRFCRALESALANNIELIILGWKEPWIGLSQKLSASYNFAKALRDNDVMLFADAYDVLYTQNPQTILDQFIASKSDIIFSGECGCWPHIVENPNACFKGYPQSSTPYRYLNSGLWIGKVSKVKIMLEEVIKRAGNNFDNANDQKLVADIYIEGKFGIKVDHEAVLFQSMHMTLDPPLPGNLARCNPREDIEAVKGRLFNKRTRSFPAVFHFNGGGKRHHLELEGKMWFRVKRSIQIDNQEFFTPQTVYGGFGRRMTAFKEICVGYAPLS